MKCLQVIVLSSVFCGSAFAQFSDTPAPGNGLNNQQPGLRSAPADEAPSPAQQPARGPRPRSAAQGPGRGAGRGAGTGRGLGPDGQPRPGRGPGQGLRQGPGAPPGQGPRSGPAAGRRQQGSPLLQVLDINRDGIISAEEISNAAESLKALDANGDGQLQPTEYRPRSAVIPGDDRAAPSDQPSDDQQLQDAIERLLAYDKNQDGQLDETEMPGRLKSIFTRADRDENGILTRREIIADARAAHSRARSDQFGPRPPASADNRPPAASGRMSLQQEAADAMLRRMDLDRNGLLGLNELPQTLRQRLTPWDMNQDQQLDLLELQKGLQADHRSFDRSQFHSPAAQE